MKAGKQGKLDIALFSRNSGASSVFYYFAGLSKENYDLS
jgi:hypothetical protein